MVDAIECIVGLWKNLKMFKNTRQVHRVLLALLKLKIHWPIVAHVVHWTSNTTNPFEARYQVLIFAKHLEYCCGSEFFTSFEFRSVRKGTRLSYYFSRSQIYLGFFWEFFAFISCTGHYRGHENQSLKVINFNLWWMFNHLVLELNKTQRKQLQTNKQSNAFVTPCILPLCFNR